MDILRLLKENDNKKHKREKSTIDVSSEEKDNVDKESIEEKVNDQVKKKNIKPVSKPPAKPKVTKKQRIAYELGIPKNKYNKFKAKKDSYGITIDNLDYETFKVLAKKFLC